VRVLHAHLAVVPAGTLDKQTVTLEPDFGSLSHTFQAERLNISLERQSINSLGGVTEAPEIGFQCHGLFI
jgi:hypothetical protein